MWKKAEHRAQMLCNNRRSRRQSRTCGKLVQVPRLCTTLRGLLRLGESHILINY